MVEQQSNINKVIKNLKLYCNENNLPIKELYISTMKNKKFMIRNPINNKLVHFGNSNYGDFTKHNDLIRQQNYLKRATKIKGNWKDNPYSPNNLSINLLWN